MIVSWSINHEIQYLPRNSVYQAIQNLGMANNGVIFFIWQPDPQQALLIKHWYNKLLAALKTHSFNFVH